ncbi:MAG: hypothetical protein DMD71_02040 [Gemmatimonadetes bacterium]|nr:MAG: hypothetical protein DMD71_02040 [Gemmatimonadota bacterium]
MVSKLSWLLIAAGVPAVLAAQTPASVQRAVNSVTPQDVVRRIAIIADDSMLGRATPSPQLEQVAQYIAAEFQRFGLRPGGERGTYFQRYSVERAVLATDSSAVWSTGSLALRWAYGTDLVEVDGRTPADAISGQVLVLVGAVPDSGGIDSAAVAGKMLLVLRPSRGARRLLGWNPAAILIPSTAPDSIWPLIARRFGSGGWRQPGPGVATTAPPQFLLRQPALQPLLSQLGLTVEAARQAPFAARAFAGTTLHARVLEQVAERATAPNVIGILEGSDPTLKREYVFFTGHMDHLGTPGSGEDCVARGADSICNGADDDGSGTIAVVKLAEAFSQLTPRPRRSLVFMTVSGEERGLWGSEYFSEHPTVPLASIVADLNTPRPAAEPRRPAPAGVEPRGHPDPLDGARFHLAAHRPAIRQWWLAAAGTGRRDHRPTAVPPPSARPAAAAESARPHRGGGAAGAVRGSRLRRHDPPRQSPGAGR